MSKRRSKKKRSNPLLAGVLLLGCAGYAATSLFGTGGQQAAPGLGVLIGLDEDQPLEDSAAAVEEIRWSDLLAVHGSYSTGVPVQLAFAAMAESTPTAAMPGGETEVVGRWRGQDPPQLKLGVVMVSAASRRAVLGGQVVGVGDQVAEGQVVAIEPGLLRLRWHQRELTYDLDGDAPREFRGELAMRRAAGGVDGGADGNQDLRAMEEVK